MKLIFILSALFVGLMSQADGFRCRALCAVVHPRSGRILELGTVKVAADVSREEAFDGLRELCEQQLHQAGMYGKVVLLKSPNRWADEKSNCVLDKNIPPQTPLPYTGDKTYLP